MANIKGPQRILYWRIRLHLYNGKSLQKRWGCKGIIHKLGGNLDG